jgi:hypothetical protein
MAVCGANVGWAVGTMVRYRAAGMAVRGSWSLEGLLSLLHAEKPVAHALVQQHEVAITHLHVRRNL